MDGIWETEAFVQLIADAVLEGFKPYKLVLEI